MFDHILIPTDGSQLAQKGVAQGIYLAKALGARVTILVVTEGFPVRPSDGAPPSAAGIDEYQEVQRMFAEEALAEAKNIAKQLGVPAETLHIADRHPADCILGTAASRMCSLIVMASHGRRGLERPILGSQTHEVLTFSPVPVLVVR